MKICWQDFLTAQNLGSVSSAMKARLLISRRPPTTWLSVGVYVCVVYKGWLVYACSCLRRTVWSKSTEQWMLSSTLDVNSPSFRNQEHQSFRRPGIIPPLKLQGPKRQKCEAKSDGRVLEEGGSPHQLRGGEYCKLPQWGLGQRPNEKCILDLSMERRKYVWRQKVS